MRALRPQIDAFLFAMDPTMSAVSYYRKLLYTALKHTIGPIDLLAGVAGAILGIADHYLPERQIMVSLGWQIPIWSFVLIVVVRLIAAPYWMAQEEAEKLSKFITDEQERQRRIAIKTQLGRFLAQAKSLLQGEPDKDEITMGAVNVRQLISNVFGEGEAALFSDNSGMTFYGDGSEKSNLQNFVRGRSRRISELIPRADALPINCDFDPTEQNT